MSEPKPEGSNPQVTEQVKAPVAVPEPVVPQAQPEAPSQPAPPAQTSPTPASAPTLTPAENRAELLSKARAFLASPQVQHQDIAAKRRFLIEKGLNGTDIDNLLQAVPAQMPTVPPRTYPQPHPSNLPALLLGLARLFSWLAGGSAVLIFIYYRFLLPRIAQTAMARQSLKSHHISLLRKFTTSLASLKESQTESFAVLPKSDPYREPEECTAATSLEELVKLAGEKDSDFAKLPPQTVLRCAITSYGKAKTGDEAVPTTQDLFRYMEGSVTWLLTDEGLEYENLLWDTLQTCPWFKNTISISAPGESSPESQGVAKWEYVPQEPTTPPPVVESLNKLVEELPKDAKHRKSPFQHGLQALSDFTGYISTQIYMPYRPPPLGTGIPNAKGQEPVEEEMRREIRTLKGLVLNRRSFLPTIPRANSTPIPTRPIP
ncbi:hypothetical protein CVT24_004919 [Panaeolus cyanescens]|uniref:Peroxisomal membrane protein PEX14 n=1 Tax=Panaeolus cyanescens TaxID=181874 RepID=A0A409VBR4_9AGAR|nr:hypothetical protein CVT24_004919 [Panaeolus cyanescens]